MKNYQPTDLIKFASRTGRWTVKKINNMPTLYTTNLGSYLRFKVSNAKKCQITVLPNQDSLSPSQVFAFRIDGGKWQRAQASLEKIDIPLDSILHTIEIMAAGNSDIDEVWQGNEGFAIKNIYLDNGAIMAAPQRPVVNFIGDSITAGCWVVGNHPAADYRPETNYAGICADLLNVDSVRIAYSAGGVLRPATGGVPTADVFLGKIDDQTLWTPNHPDLTVINLGVNDRRFPLAQFTAAFDLFIQQVKLTFPHTPLAIIIPFSQTFASEIRKIATKHNCSIIETKTWSHSFTDGLHPDQAGAIAEGKMLAQALQPLLSQFSVQ
ncbi:SGNH/GDSL hydrolase family protein [Limosilactobacillus reuteri]|jgi:lysophospholipase L1-like esterase|uniref:SGNH/GDSL hydrolase family protein n=1 Tax=Limosilactobacillus reuteri TaxID=1598 RepID=A0AAW6JHR9_LIMRT|nr:SGNH/GDSL hydrolase family protein [Limosilactobacillus reuteri]MBM6812041.1 SGNH/GDSL hydrolase family protein [Limosilactobacillus reuteri]MCC4499434.1 SGNH/GDSL hydrolase family protein [Limosilactobacillus reuteri]MCC4503696.1 SGNH/GDSL hydrolase family protein [Limosilactobacillus reuteri]MCC4505925.1 SGNH/GDSL hydrolase family protein [Limosilactobacillus reuteri]MCC4514327.1 SGNH/GDSL hydrolase family protein [Limosilactobacillus reuteri]